ncbi:DUF222 domain-containing protein [Dermatophilaceae bacterium Sec6.4]
MSSNTAWVDTPALTPPDPRTALSHVVGRLNAAHAELVTLVTQVLADQSWVIGGIRSPQHWLTCYAGLSHAVATDIVRIAERSGALPALAQGLTGGDLSIGQASVIARYTPDNFDTDVVELARHASVPQLRRALSKYEFSPTPAAAATAATTAATVERLDEFDPTVQRAQVHMHTQDGRFHLTYDAPADIGALVHQAVVEAKDALFLAGHPHVTMGEALLEVATRSLQQGTDLSTGRSNTFRIYLHLDTSGHGWITNSGALPPHLLRQWTCNGLVNPVWETSGPPVNVGRAQRIVPARTRRLIEDRDGGCAHPGCGATGHLECHHITHWADGGPTNVENLISLCPYHHDRHHTGDFTIEPLPAHPGHYRFLDRGGAPLGPIERRTPTTNEPDPQTTPYRGASGQALHLAWVRFAPNPTPATTRDRRKLWILAGGTGDPPDPPDRTRSPDPHTAAAED